MAAASLVVRISAQLAEFQKSFDDANKTLNKFSSEFQGAATKAATVGAFFGTIAANIAGSLAHGLGSAIADAVKFSSQFSNAFIGLASVARAFGTNTDEAAAAAKRLSADGLLPLKDSATGLKNLLAAGFNLPQATKLMDAFKDSAAFGRQGALSFGDAVRSATEGVKNGNSILVDNAGVTKNLSQILKEAGFSAQDLSRASSDVGVRMALFNGILKETRAQTGDAAKLTQTYAGQLEGMKTSWTNLLAVWGDAITRNKTVADALGFVRDAFSRLSVFLNDNQRGFNLVSDAVIAFVQVLAGTVRAINAVHTAFTTIDTALIFVARSILEAVQTIATALIDLVKMAAKIPGAATALGLMGNEIASLFIVSDKTAKGIAALSDRIAGNNAATAGWNRALGGMATELDGLATHLKETRGQTVQLGDSTNTAAARLDQFSGAATKAAAATAKATKEASELNDAMISIRSTILSVAKTIEEGWVRAMKEMDDEIFSTIGDINKVNDAISETFASQELSAAMEDVRGDIALVARTIDKVGESAKKAATDGLDEIARSLSQLSEISGGAFSGIVRGLSQMVGATDVVMKSLDKLGSGLLKTLDFSKAGFAGTVGALLAMSAAAVQAGHALGGLLGLRTGKLGALLGTNATGRQAVIDFAATFGGFDELHKRLLTMGAEGEALWVKLTQGVGRANPQEAAAAINKINDAFGTQAERISKTQAVLDEYGITFEQTGEKFRNATLAGAFDTLLEKTQILKDAGVDYNLILEKQAGDYSELTKKAIESGTEIPSSMRPILEQLSTMGLLTDKATGEFIDLGNVKWATTLTEGFKSVTDSVDRLSDTLLNLGRTRIKIPISFDVDAIPGGGSVPAMASGGIVRRPTLALVGESGPEAVVPLSRLGNMGSDRPIVVQTILDGRLVAETIANVARRYGLA